MDAITLIKADHKAVEALFAKFEANKDDVGSRRDLVERISAELVVHAAVEEEVFYPRLKAKADEDGRELVAEAYEEHHVVKVLIAELAELDPSDEAYLAKATVLIENVRHHVEEEEDEMLPEAEEILGSDLLDQLGERMAERKKQLMASVRPGHPDPSPAGRSRDQLYADAQRLGVHGRSRMTKEQLADAVAALR
jgi:hemerythrin-like domain-containing protein